MLVFAFVAPLSAHAQPLSSAQADDGKAAKSEATTDGSGRKNVTAAGYTTTDEPYQPRRGLSIEGDLGIFFTLGGRNSNDTNPNDLFPSRVSSNANPYLAIVVGYDVFATDSFALSIGPKVGVGFNGGASRVTAEDVDVVGVEGGSTFANDYAIYEAGLNIGLSFMVSERLALTGKLSGGAVFIDANPNVDYCGANADSDGPSPILDVDPTVVEVEAFRDACGNSGAGDLAVGALFAGAVGVEWYTLLNGFSVGLEVRYHGLLVDGFFSGVAIPATLRYTF